MNTQTPTPYRTEYMQQVMTDTWNPETITDEQDEAYMKAWAFRISQRLRKDHIPEDNGTIVEQTIKKLIEYGLYKPQTDGVTPYYSMAECILKTVVPPTELETAFEKCADVIDSCYDQAQLDVCEKLITIFFKKFKDEEKSNLLLGCIFHQRRLIKKANK